MFKVQSRIFFLRMRSKILTLAVAVLNLSN